VLNWPAVGPDRTSGRTLARQAGEVTTEGYNRSCASRLRG
jgi:hypothetical protein